VTLGERLAAAISLMAGEVASLLLSRMTVPLVYYAVRRREAGRAAVALGGPAPSSETRAGPERSAA
jgi:hypothetical protein